MKSNKTQKHKPHKASFWQQKTEEWSNSNLTQKAFCASHNLTLSTFVYWKGKIARQNKGTMLLPVQIVPESQDLSASGLSVTIRERFKINLEKDFCPETLCRLALLLERL